MNFPGSFFTAATKSLNVAQGASAFTTKAAGLIWVRQINVISSYLKGILGVKAGVSYAEQFRYEKLGMLDNLLGTQFVQPDFQ